MHPGMLHWVFYQLKALQELIQKEIHERRVAEIIYYISHENIFNSF